MKAEYINPFIASAMNVLKQMTGSDVKRGDIALRKGIQPKYEVAVTLGVVGDIRGDVAYSMSTQTALKLAGAMAMGMQFDDIQNEIVRSAIGELGNMITGGAVTELAAKGIKADISPPSIIIGKNIKVFSTLPSVVIPLLTDFGEIEISVSLEETEK